MKGRAPFSRAATTSCGLSLLKYLLACCERRGSGMEEGPLLTREPTTVVNIAKSGMIGLDWVLFFFACAFMVP